MVETSENHFKIKTPGLTISNGEKVFRGWYSESFNGATQYCFAITSYLFAAVVGKKNHTQTNKHTRTHAYTHKKIPLQIIISCTGLREPQ